ncbi:MAG: alkaline phosphatase family protein [Thermoanaerobaculia bacterium]|nr:alkaline phosphatase family protein [Thermoanaerobaculia bacterium]
MSPYKILLGLVLVASAGLLAGVAYDTVNRPELTFEPVREPSALDDTGPIWSAAAEAASVACNDATTLPRRWMVFGWDGVDWQFVLPLLRQGRLPHLESLLRNGAYGSLASIVPTLSPAIWTTVATGRTPGDHQILHFYNQRPILERWWQRLTNLGALERQLYTNADRRNRAVWNLLSEYDRSVMLVGYHNTFPVEPVNGLMVSNYLMQDSVARAMEMDSGGSGDSSTLAAGLVHPPDKLDEVLDLQRKVNGRIPHVIDEFVGLSETERNDFLRASRRLNPDTDQKPYFLVHAWVFDTIVAEIADEFLGRSQPDLAMVHFQAADWASHRFLYYRAPELYEDMDWSEETRSRLDADSERYRDTVDAFYVYLDRWLGKLLEHRADDTGVLLLSDHGFAADTDPDIPGGHDHAPPGIVVLHGPGIRPGKIDGATVYDVLPTLMASMDLPLAEDLPGAPLVQAFCDGAYDPTTQETVDSYGSGTPYVPTVSKPDELDQELLQQLRSLGYID